ncbi:MAG: hypothetical protein H6Q68_286 [Firmicutes bacterium]|nr:hypothetical protein [Bacillota bacterium]
MIKKLNISFVFLLLLLARHEEIIVINIGALKSSLWPIVKWATCIVGTYLVHYLISSCSSNRSLKQKQ